MGARAWIGAGVAAWLAAACAPHRLEIPRPHLESRRQVEPPPSVVELPIHLDLRAMEAYLDVRLPPVIERQIDRLLVPGAEAQIAYRVERGPVTLRAEGDRVVGSVEVRWWAGLCLRQFPLRCVEVAACGPAVSTVELASELQLDPAWALTSDTDYEVKHPAGCTLTPLRFDATGLFDEVLHGELDKLVALADREMPKLATFEKEATSAWRFLQKPLRLREDLWLVFDPRSVHGGGIVGTKHALSTTLLVRARPRLVVGPRPTTGKAPLPPLDLRTPGPRGVRLALSSRVPLDELTREARRELVGRTIDFGGHTVEIRDIRVEAAKDSDVPVVAVDLRRHSPALDARIYFTAVPRWDAARNRLVLGKLDYALETRSALLRSSDWLLHPELRERIEKALEHGADVGLDKLIARIDRSLDRKIGRSVLLRGKILGVESIDAAVVGDELEAVAVVRARVELRIRPALPIQHP